MMKAFSLPLALLAIGLFQPPASAAGIQPVTTGKVLRGVNAPPPEGVSGTSDGRTCDFSREEIDHNGRMTGASVQCGSDDVRTLLAGLPDTFNSYCEVTASRLGGRLISAPIKGNARHCDLSGISRKDAEEKFGGGKWK